MLGRSELHPSGAQCLISQKKAIAYCVYGPDNTAFWFSGAVLHGGKATQQCPSLEYFLHFIFELRGEEMPGSLGVKGIVTESALI